MIVRGSVFHERGHSKADIGGHCVWDACIVETTVVITVGEIATAAGVGAVIGAASGWLAKHWDGVKAAVVKAAPGVSMTDLPSEQHALNVLHAQEAQEQQGNGQSGGNGQQNGQSQDGQASGSTGGMKPGSAGGPGAGKKTTPQQRKNTLKQNGGKCVVPGCNENAEHTDHAIARSRDGDTTEANLQGMCAHHNCQKGAKSSAEYEQWRKDHPDKK